MRTILPSLTLCLILSSCSSPPPPADPVQVHWEFLPAQPGEPVKACLPETDVAKLREALIRCKAESDE